VLASKAGQQLARFEQFEQDDVAHAEAERGQVHFAAADEFDEIVVTSAAGDGAEFAPGDRMPRTRPRCSRPVRGWTW